MADNKILIEVGITGDAEVKFKRLGDAVDDFSDKGTKGLGRFSGAFDVFAGTIGAQAVIGAFTRLTSAAAALAETLLVDGVKAAEENEIATAKLTQALVSSGKYSAVAREELIAYSDELQRNSKFSNDAILEAEGLIQSLGRLDKEGLKRATKAALDLSTSLGIDLQTAALQVGKAASGEVSSFSRYGIKIAETKDKAQTFERALGALEQRFGGSAAAQVGTYSGAVAVLSNAFDDAKKEVGLAIIQNQSLVNVIRTLSKIVDEGAASIKGNRSAMSDFVTKGVLIAIDGASLLVAGLETASIMFLQLEKAARTAQVGVSAIAEAIGFEDAGKRAEAGAERVMEIDRAIKQLESGKGTLGAVQDGLQRIRGAAEEGVGKVVDIVPRGTQAMRDFGDASNAAAEAQKKLVDEGVRLSEQGAGKDPNVEFEARLEALNAAFEAEEISYTERNIALNAFEEERFAKVSELRTNEAELIIAQNQMLTQDNLFRHETEILSNQERLKRITIDENISAKDRLKIQQAYANQSRVIENERKEAISNSLNALASLQNLKTKELAAVGKAAAIAQTVIETYSGATKAASALAGIPFIGPALAVAAAAAFITSGLARVAMISGVQLSEGLTEVPPGFSNDNFPARLKSGERVVDGGTNQDLKLFLGGANQMVPLLAAILAQLRIGRSPVIVNVGSRVVLDEVRDGLRSGRTIDV